MGLLRVPEEWLDKKRPPREPIRTVQLLGSKNHTRRRTKRRQQHSESIEGARPSRLSTVAGRQSLWQRRDDGLRQSLGYGNCLLVPKKLNQPWPRSARRQKKRGKHAPSKLQLGGATCKTRNAHATLSDLWREPRRRQRQSGGVKLPGAAAWHLRHTMFRALGSLCRATKRGTKKVRRPAMQKGRLHQMSLLVRQWQIIQQRLSADVSTGGARPTEQQHARQLSKPQGQWPRLRVNSVTLETSSWLMLFESFQKM